MVPHRAPRLIDSIFSFVLLYALLVGTAGAQVSEEALLQSFRWRNIGPANIGGRVVDIEAVEGDFKRVYLASASGGVWKSVNAGVTWEPIFDRYGAASIGDIGLFQPDPDIVWVGTGEANNRNSVSWGDGVYKSTDGGLTFANMGLEETHHIARIVTHPTDPDDVFVCAAGRLWGYSGDRGLFHTTDGGESWTQITARLPDDGKTGCTDLAMDPSDAGILYAAFYHRIRQPWTFHSGGPGGGIFKSTDGGRTWTKLTNGLPAGDTGRIGLAIYRSDPRIVMAIVEAERTDDLSIPGSGIYRSEDGGASWRYVNTYNNRPFYYSQIRINPLDDRRVYVLTTRFMVSDDGGATLRDGSEDREIHGDFHAMWLDPADADRYYIGADKGASLTHDHGAHFQLFDNLPIGQYYRIGIDMRDPYYVYGGLQDNGTFGVPSFSRDARGILNDSNWKLHWGDGQDVQIDPTNWRNVYTKMENGKIFRYDALSYEMESIRPALQRITNYSEVIPEELRDGGREFRYNWSAPIVMSPHDPKTLFAGANFLFKTIDGGESWTIASPDLTTSDPDKCTPGNSGGLTPDNSGAEYHCSITTIAPSPLNPDVIWVGTDDGLAHVTRDGGRSWTGVRDRVPGVPGGIWVSRIETSHFFEGMAYVVFDGHRSDIFTPWIFKTEDFGRTWTRITDGIPEGHVVRVVREDLRNPRLLFAGTEFGIMASLNGGSSWFSLQINLPTVAVPDLIIHSRDNDLIAGTHGRSLWILDDISPLQQLTEPVSASKAFLFEQKPVTLWKNTSRGGQRGHFWFAGENPPTIENTTSLPRAGFRNTALIAYYIGREAESAHLEISSDTGLRYTAPLETQPGIHRHRWNLEFEPPPLTEEQKQHVVNVFERLSKSESTPALQQGYEAFKSAVTPAEERQALRVLKNGFFDTDLGDNFDMPRAGPGIYIVRITVDGETFEETLVVRDDPLVERIE